MEWRGKELKKGGRGENNTKHSPLIVKPLVWHWWHLQVMSQYSIPLLALLSEGWAYADKTVFFRWPLMAKTRFRHYIQGWTFEQANEKTFLVSLRALKNVDRTMWFFSTINSTCALNNAWKWPLYRTSLPTRFCSRLSAPFNHFRVHQHLPLLLRWRLLHSQRQWRRIRVIDASPRLLFEPLIHNWKQEKNRKLPFLRERRWKLMLDNFVCSTDYYFNEVWSRLTQTCSRKKDLSRNRAAMKETVE